MGTAKILFLDSYTRPDGESSASDEIGYGVTAGQAIKDQLRHAGYTVDDLSTWGLRADSKLDWIHGSYQLLQTMPLHSYDVIFIFHIFHHFPSEVRRILLERGLHHIKIVGYTHGSHWDETDTFRTKFFPNMHAVDLANLLCLDQVFIVSHYFRKLLLRNISLWSVPAAAELTQRIIVTGLPINNVLIDTFQADQNSNKIQIVFNHSPTPGKEPAMFFDLMKHVLSQQDVLLVVTRKFTAENPGYEELQHLYQLFPNQVILGNTLSLRDYYVTLWQSHIQVSTASHETLGVATLEAMYTYNCCILPNRQSYPELTGGAGLYSSDQELLELIMKYICDDNLRRETGSYMHQQSLRYLPEPVVQQISTAIETMLAR